MLTNLRWFIILINLHKYFILSEIKDFTNSFIKEKKTNFKKIDLFVEEQKLKKLLSRTPLSTKNGFSPE